jgi:hypothetical protein
MGVKGRAKPQANKVDLYKPLPPELKPNPIDPFEKNTKRLGGLEKWKHDVELLKIEWAIKYPNMKPGDWLVDIKGYAPDQKTTIFKTSPEKNWHIEKDKILDKITESTVKRHIDLIAEVQEQHVAASKLGLARAIEMLTNNGIKMRSKKDGKEITMPLRSIDLLNAMSSIEKAQQIYRRAMGLANEEGGLAQILEKVQQVTIQQNIQNNTQVNNTTVVQSESTTVSAELAEKLDYDTVMEFIEYRRELKAKASIDQDSALVPALGTKNE